MKWVRTNTNDPESFIAAYINKEERLAPFFDYEMSQTAEHQRLKELEPLNFDRETLGAILSDCNENLGRGGETAEQIRRFKQTDSAVVIGGQQSGLLGGPMYTAHKMISIVIEASRLEQTHGIPVIPVFWIAGEDHDIDEVNHTYFTDGVSTKKIRVPERNAEKTPVSERSFSKDEALEALLSAVKFLPETNVTAELLKALKGDIAEASTYTEWFARWMDKLFPDSPILFIDAHDERLREFERPYFQEMIRKNAEIRSGFLAKGEALNNSGWGEPITLDPDNAHIFIHVDGERHLLKFTDGYFLNEQTGRYWTEHELIEAAEERPLKLSNNVVTRPVMQDLVFPVLTFIGGPGEVKYWAVLKEVFHAFNHAMPIVKPRLQFTFIPRRAEKTLGRYGLSPGHVIRNGVEEEKQRITQDSETVNEAELFADTRLKLDNTADWLNEQLPDEHMFINASEKFSYRLRKALAEFEKEIKAGREQQNSHHLNRLNGLACWLIPDGVPQERRLNAVPLVNLYGWDVFERIQNELLSHQNTIEPGDHIFVYL
ncbi:bacillithiol biosynthesis cysteine-adding enzyme BshC [Salisediminibacterium halotolerans]|uniref:bacillithiol biosynthesis cysteine-adding enzyme BshC n=1 Tax=Salisediminibacterium halotolerans TaxID=517425 RepID=UPI000EAEEF7D|nr:bacillithiol biosynthesis cysteine-adding enzyme BshC [Salisediminibacterium halotolerans]RLJ74315.1 bacillithiol biosynthesis cysteine-adding enzyme BshC [Actinophytocola xinjiangensis]RPE87592.1 bacillithiol biosynthesis cysteine-adding enzyme BshC [Salisediminibacterium halotolerans]TWG35152.1 bacillithiol biosynthesis cysteine-adding enzyme BshC [Salisediminibacterium halotolerans]GEL09133.1 putative cysteine ligase BshC [Salisediminibacterium halotolerans]